VQSRRPVAYLAGLARAPAVGDLSRSCR
jgi:hypothetical protein